MQIWPADYTCGPLVIIHSDHANEIPKNVHCFRISNDSLNVEVSKNQDKLSTSLVVLRTELESP
jgi:hypothetical protein